MTEATKTIESCLSVESIRRGTPWRYFEDYQERFTTVITTLGRQCREWADGETDRAVEAIIAEHSTDEDAVVFTDGSQFSEASSLAGLSRLDLMVKQSQKDQGQLISPHRVC